MKKMIAVLCMMAAAAAVFASGAQEVNEEGIVELEKGELARNSYLEDLDKIELKGTIKFESPVAELTSGGKDYTLMAPGSREFMQYISEGDRMTVTGYILDEDSMPGPMGGRMFGNTQGGRMSGNMQDRGIHQDFDVLEDNITLLVETVTIDGKTYQLPWVDDDYGFGMRRDEDGRMSGRMQQDQQSGNRMRKF